MPQGRIPKTQHILMAFGKINLVGERRTGDRHELVRQVPQQAGRAVVSSEDAQVAALSRAIKESLKREIIEEISPLSDVAPMPYGGGAAEIRTPRGELKDSGKKGSSESKDKKKLR